MFCVNNKEYTVEIHRGSKIYTIHDFWKYPDKIIDLLVNNSDGILTISIPKIEPEQPKKHSVKIS